MIEDNKKIYKENKSIQDKLNDDPFMDYGFGIVAFFQLMRTLIYVYIVISILACVMMWFYTFGDAIEKDRNGAVSQLSLGNYGFAMYKCFIQYIELKESTQL
jgi:hypothetical protein